MHLLYVPLLLLWLWNCQANPIVNLTDGVVQGGRTRDNRLNISYDFFLGIPYAEAPIGELMFKPPKKRKPWSGIFDATKIGNICPQMRYTFGNNELRKKIYNNKNIDLKNIDLEMTGDHDCLNLNVYIPIREVSEYPLPVMIWIHGGGFTQGSGSPLHFGPQLLLKKNVVIVSINYRLGIYGFLGLETANYPGNNGLKDQRLAFQWVHDNIDKFGGNPKQITIFGESAGGSSVNYHLLSPSSNLFQNAISQSGNVNMPWGFVPHMRNNILEIAELLNCTQDDDNELVKCLKSRNVKEEMLASMIIQLRHYFKNDINLIISPTSEPEGAEELFFTGNPRELTKRGKFHNVTYISGITSEEAGSFALLYLLLGNSLENVRKNISLIFNDQFRENIKDKGLKIDYVAKEVEKFYFHKQNDLDEYVLAFSDVYYTAGALETLADMSCNNPKQNYYFYEFNYIGKISDQQPGILSGNLKTSQSSEISLSIFGAERNTYITYGVRHSGELDFLWIKKKWTKLDKNDSQEIDLMTTMWTNFAKYGNPGPNWPSLKKNNITLIEIDLKTKVIGEESPFEKRINFWKNLFNLNCKSVEAWKKKNASSKNMALLELILLVIIIVYNV